MSLKSAKEIWDYLKAEYAGDERIRGMKVLNLIRDFELQKMKESESVKEYSDRLLSIANKVKLLRSELNDFRIVIKLLVTIPEKFEATITTLENTKDLLKISPAELLNALQAQEQRISMSQEGVIEGALPVKHQDNNRYKKKKNFKNQLTSEENSSGNYQKSKRGGVKKSYPPCHHCEKKGRESSESWLIDSGCTNHMTYNKKLFEELRNTEVKRVRIGNGEYLEVKGKGTCLIRDANGRNLFNVKMKGKSFALNPMENEQITFKPRVSATETWHKRLGQFHNRGLLQMQSKKQVERLTDIDDDLPHF
ncbi:uncharacterized protein LOC128043079 [Gossypium raimondii]|uniref:uncharacterized protein LOC128043079 n=1 Tax=Gossypium raimondii TaxID=29730 RepID=UPI00227A1ABD|nr:uncharacterized protein LOC128043079 [Gossypium raimondii]